MDTRSLELEALVDLPDELFDFDSALNNAVQFPDDSLALSVLRASYDRIVMSQDLARLQQVTMQLAATACNHAHLQNFSTGLGDNLFRTSENDGNLNFHAHSHGYKNKYHEDEDDEEED